MSVISRSRTKYIGIGLCLLLITALIVNFAPAAEEDEQYFIFQQRGWGISQEEVEELATGELLEKKEDRMIYSDQLLEMDVLKDYLFYRNQLSGITFRFQPVHEEPNEYIDEYEQVKVLVETIFSGPDSDEELWMDSRIKQSTPEDDRGDAVVKGHLTFLAEWEREETHTTHVLHGTTTLTGEADDEVNHILVFLSEELEEQMLEDMLRGD